MIILNDKVKFCLAPFLPIGSRRKTEKKQRSATNLTRVKRTVLRGNVTDYSVLTPFKLSPNGCILEKWHCSHIKNIR